MDKIVLNNECGSPCITLQVIEYIPDIEQYVFDVGIDHNGFICKGRSYGEKYDLLELKRALSMMYDGTLISYEYVPQVDVHMKIGFNRNQYGDVYVKCSFADSEYSCKMEINFKMDITYIPEINRQIESIC